MAFLQKFFARIITLLLTIFGTINPNVQDVEPITFDTVNYANTGSNYDATVVQESFDLNGKDSWATIQLKVRDYGAYYFEIDNDRSYFPSEIEYEFGYIGDSGDFENVWTNEKYFLDYSKPGSIGPIKFAIWLEGDVLGTEQLTYRLRIKNPGNIKTHYTLKYGYLGGTELSKNAGVYRLTPKDVNGETLFNSTTWLNLLPRNVYVNKTGLDVMGGKGTMSDSTVRKEKDVLNERLSKEKFLVAYINQHDVYKFFDSFAEFIKIRDMSKTEYWKHTEKKLRAEDDFNDEILTSGAQLAIAIADIMGLIDEIPWIGGKISAALDVAEVITAAYEFFQSFPDEDILDEYTAYTLKAELAKVIEAEKQKVGYVTKDNSQIDTTYLIERNRGVYIEVRGDGSVLVKLINDANGSNNKICGQYGAAGVALTLDQFFNYASENK